MFKKEVKNKTNFAKTGSHQNKTNLPTQIKNQTNDKPSPINLPAYSRRQRARVDWSLDKQKNNPEISSILTKNIRNPLWVSVSEAAKLGGIQTKTIRRAVKSNTISYKIIGNRYLINFSSLIIYLHTKIKLKNKLNQHGIGQYIEKWRK